MRFTLVLAALLTLPAFIQPAAAHKPIVAGPLTLNPHDVIAVYRPVDQRAVAVFVGRPGQGIQAIVVNEPKEAAACFNALWDNTDFVKDPGDADVRPLTRMCLKDQERKRPTLIANVARLMAVAWDADRSRGVRVYLDKLIANQLLVDPNDQHEGREYLEIPNSHEEADTVMAAYKACVYARER